MLSVDKLHAQTLESNTVLNGRYVLQGASCAGFNFIDSKTVLWTNEIACNDPDTLRLTWVDASTFMTRTKEMTNKDCPPSVSLYKIVSISGNKLVLKDIWTGWNDSKSKILVFNKQ